VARPESHPSKRTPLPATYFNGNSVMKIPNHFLPKLVQYTYQLVGIAMRLLS
jgi:hypothetical protein